MTQRIEEQGDRRVGASAKLAKRLGTYAVAGATAAVGGVEVTEAALVNSAAGPIVFNNVGSNAPFIGVSVDVDGDAVNDFQFAQNGTFNGVGFPATSSFFNVYGQGANQVGVVGVPIFIGGANYVSAIGALPASASWAGTSGTGAGILGIGYQSLIYGGLNAPGGLFIGLQFDIGGNTHFGRAFVTVVQPTAFGSGDGSVTIDNFQYESTPNAPIPEPSSLALLAIGAAGVVARRRNRASA